MNLKKSFAGQGSEIWLNSVRANKKSKLFFSNDRVLTSVLAFPVHIEGGSTEKSCVSGLYDLYFLVENVFFTDFFRFLRFGKSKST